jgi:DNA-directed RNA polymerase specialized sigma24 family protein
MSLLSPSPFTALDDAFAALSLGPRPLSFDGCTVVGLPDRAIPLVELRQFLLRPSTPYAVRDAVIRSLVSRAKSDGGAATIALAGMVLPGLRRAAYSLVRACPDRAADVEADMLAGLLSALARVTPSRRRPAGYLVGMAFTAAKKTVREELAERGRVTHAPHGSPPQPPFGHPDFILGEAVLDGVFSPDDAELIGSTRLGHVNLKQAARARGVTYDAIRLRRSRAEQRLKAYLAGVPLDGACHCETDPPRSDTPSPDTNGPSPASSEGVKSPQREGGTTGDPGLVPMPNGPREPRR